AYKHVIISEGRSIGEEESEYESQHTTNIIIFNINKKRVIKDRGKRLPIPGKYGIKADYEDEGEDEKMVQDIISK
ncbi:6436_t:CDS:2, partial [Entrophospora sp. SA101]